MKHVGLVILTVLIFTLICIPHSILPSFASASTNPALTRLLLATRQVSHDIPLDKDAVLINRKQFACLSRLIPPRCYTPRQILQAYQIRPLFEAGITGKGQTIAIIGFFQSPHLFTDVHIFDQLFGLPDPHLTIFAPLGLMPLDRSNRSQLLAAQEINLDVEWAHAIAPDAKINLVLSKSAGIEDLYATTRFAIQHNLGDVLTQSFGFPETAIAVKMLRKEHALFEEARARGISVFASSGDRGTLEPVYNNVLKLISLGPGVEYPASDPLVTSVGGTHLSLSPSGIYQQEEAWSNRLGATGGGFSRRFLRPSYQDGFVGASRTRGVPDVAYVGDPRTGVPIIFSLKQGPAFIPIGGTSAGAPQWAALAVLGNQLAGRRLGFLNPSLYALSKNPFYPHVFHDVLSGSNTLAVHVLRSTVSFPGYNARQGWDPATGLGSPVANRLLIALAQNKLFNPITLHYTKKTTSARMYIPLRRHWHLAFYGFTRHRHYRRIYRRALILHSDYLHCPLYGYVFFHFYHTYTPRRLIC
ncbi:S53 family peptidase [Dictyobacter aurantiacus]|uniref:Peptidase S53 domain-containing protein n=1 Tax=Dictyobacter aurantiacus TaxID=1936993 RepID=A0A401Z784_9CHLR|nr:S53 family peptidase [Dictyobacter aurantiacus]GCE02730.1 hypothetical protein KDAU_00590 [Dictyobacter aurantiacus]